MVRKVTCLVAGAGVLAMAVATAATLTAAEPVRAAQRCDQREAIVKVLSERFGERRQGFGLQTGANILELFASPAGGWTALVSFPNGTSCIVAIGEAWTEVPAQPAGPNA